MTTRLTAGGVEISQRINGMNVRRHYISHTPKEALEMFINFANEQAKIKKFIVFQDGKRIGFLYGTSIDNAHQLASSRRTGKIVVFNEDLTEFREK